MVLAYGKTLVKNDSPFTKTQFPPYEMVGGWAFGRTLGAMILCCAMNFQLCSSWQFIKMLG